MRESCPDLSTSVQKAQVVTRVAYSQDLTAAKCAQLHEQAKRLGRIRSEVWDRYRSDCPTKTLVAPAMASTVSVTLNDAQMCTTF